MKHYLYDVYFTLAAPSCNMLKQRHINIYETQPNENKNKQMLKVTITV